MNKNPTIENRLVLIGNGFDIANQLPTRYSDFMTNFLFRKFMLAYKNENGFYEDEYFVIQKFKRCHFQPNNLSNNITPLKDYIRFRSNNYYQINDSNRDKLLPNIQLHEPSLTDIYFHVKDKFLNQLFDIAKEFNWVDIESEYYKKLINVTLKNDPILSLIEPYSVKQLHSTFKMIQDEFVKYLKTIDYNKFTQSIADIFDFPINYNFDHRKRNKNDKEIRPKETLILNFNYTPTISAYNKYANWNDEFQILNIHGEINNPDNPIIFGYGDETIPSYKKLEELNNDEVLQFMKNKDYALTTNYARLISFIESAPFEVYILGHSCGLSDRVMLNTIFEKEECQAIYIFPYKHQNGTDNFMDVYHNISRQFSLNKRAELRKKVKAKSISMVFPQSNQ